jgi:FixJ family two-component response regulator
VDQVHPAFHYSIIPLFPHSTISIFHHSNLPYSIIPLFQCSTIPLSCAMTQHPPTVLLIDDDPSVRRALARLIKSAGYQAQTFVSAREFLDRMPDATCPACLVLDVRMPGLSGLDLQRELKAANATLPIIFITGHGDIPMSVKAMKDGAVDFLPKPVKDKDLLRAIEQALARAVHDRAELDEAEDIQSRVEKLTPREREVMSLVVKGWLNKQIASELGTVEKTVKVHRARVMDKMQVDSVAELVRIAQKIGVPPKSN